LASNSGEAVQAIHRLHRLHIYETGTVVKRIYPSPRQTSSGERRDVHNSC